MEITAVDHRERWVQLGGLQSWSLTTYTGIDRSGNVLLAKAGSDVAGETIRQVEQYVRGLYVLYNAKCFAAKGNGKSRNYGLFLRKAFFL